jgi:hypothetical protein
MYRPNKNSLVLRQLDNDLRALYCAVWVRSSRPLDLHAAMQRLDERVLTELSIDLADVATWCGHWEKLGITVPFKEINYSKDWLATIRKQLNRVDRDE